MVQVVGQYRKEIDEGLMGVMTLGESLDGYGHDLTIGVTGAIAKKGSAPGGEVRVIYDGTNGICLNYGVKVRDQVKFPSAPDIKAVLAEMYEEGGAFISLLFDVGKAHRRVPIIPEEWGRQACQVSGTAAAKAQKLRSDWRQSASDGDRPPPLKRADFTPRSYRKTCASTRSDILVSPRRDNGGAGRERP